MKHLLIISVFLLLFLSSKAQIHIGFQAGVNTSKAFLHFDDAPNVYVQNWIPVAFPSLSIPVEIEIKPYLSFVSGLQYIEVGNNLLLKTDLMEDTVTNKMQFLKIPIGLKYNLELKLFSLNGLAGMYVSKMIGIQQRRSLFSDDPNTLISDFYSIDYGVWVGFGLERTLANAIKMNITFKRNVGLRNLRGSRGEDLFMDSTEMVVGLSIPLKNRID